MVRHVDAVTGCSWDCRPSNCVHILEEHVLAQGRVLVVLLLGGVRSGCVGYDASKFLDRSGRWTGLRSMRKPGLDNRLSQVICMIDLLQVKQCYGACSILSSLGCNTLAQSRRYSSQERDGGFAIEVLERQGSMGAYRLDQQTVLSCKSMYWKPSASIMTRHGHI